MKNPGLSLLAVIVTRGSSNNLFQVATLVRAATALEWPVRVLFRDDAALKLARDRINRDEWSALYKPIADALAERLHAADFADMSTFLRDAKEHGDDVRFWVCQDSLSDGQLAVEDLPTSIDGCMSAEEFAAATVNTWATLTF